ncbi:GlsB/YeaQ/YmgE family stress response membrane protein [Sutcliffiella deserti]|uniref:GlsB/YeaQ/YmgE family stress response membrane protein n=1 Tax=Sutcliffiella deserti TaxID=2875501 RepID=UPI001CBDDE8F|nr:GlsB/YeaQ/YmgE family stress response membrane protein [Sutcliffiella deserti]
MLGLLITLIIAIVIGMIGSAIAPGGMPGGILGAMIAGLVGAWIGHALLGSWGPVLADIAIVPAIIGAVIFVFLLSLVSKAMHSATN